MVTRNSLRAALGLALVSAVGVPIVLATSPAGAIDVVAVSGSAFGAEVDIRGDADESFGPAPSVTLPTTGGGPFNSTLNTGGDGVFLTTGALDVTTEGTDVGTSSGSATSVAEVSNVAFQNLIFDADQVVSECASGVDASVGQTTLTNASTLNGDLPTNPAPNTTLTVGDWTVVVNEQVAHESAIGLTSITVNAVRLTPGSGLDLSGDVIIGQVQCGAYRFDTDAPGNGGVPCPGLPSTSADGEIAGSGIGILNTTGDGQTAGVGLQPGQRASEFLSYRNGDTAPQDIVVRASHGSLSGEFKVKAFRNDRDITAKVFGLNGKRFRAIPDGEFTPAVRIQIRRVADPPVDGAIRVRVTGNYGSASVCADTVRMLGNVLD